MTRRHFLKAVLVSLGAAALPAAAAACPRPDPDALSPEGMVRLADRIALKLLGLPEPVKNAELHQLKIHNRTLHAVVRASLKHLQRRFNQAIVAGFNQAIVADRVVPFRLLKL